MLTGRMENILPWMNHPRLQIIEHNIEKDIYLEADQIYHLASPTSIEYIQDHPIETIRSISFGIITVLGLANRLKATILLASSGAVYGSAPSRYTDSGYHNSLNSRSITRTRSTIYHTAPDVYVARETYWGSVDSSSQESSFAQGTRAAETMMYAYHKRNAVDVRIARIFDVYGPRMKFMHRNLERTSFGSLVGYLVDDNSYVGTCIAKALLNEQIVVPGDGLQVRTLTFVDDVISALISAMNIETDESANPINIGSSHTTTLLDIAHYVKAFTNSNSTITTAKLLRRQQKKQRQNGNFKLSHNKTREETYVGFKKNPNHMNGYLTSSHRSVVIPDVSHAKRILDWEAKMPFSIGLHLTVEHIKEDLKALGYL